MKREDSSESAELDSDHGDVDPSHGAGFADQDGRWREGFEPVSDGFFSVGNPGGLLVMTEVEVELGDVDSDMDFHGGNVYSSTCDTNSIGSRNCSSWKHAPERIELTRELMGSSPERSHLRRLFPGGWPASRKNRQADSRQFTGQVQDTSPDLDARRAGD